MKIKILFFCILIEVVFSSNWKSNPLILQNPHTFFWDSNEKYSTPFNQEPFVPPLLKFNYPIDTYLSPPIPVLIPQEIPNKWYLPSVIPELSQIEEPIFEKNFIISYQFLLKNEIPQGDKYNISEPLGSMSKKNFLNYSCQFDVSLEDDIGIPDVLDILLKSILQNYKDAVLECLYKSGVKLREDSILNSSRVNNKILFTLPPTWVRVSLQNGFLIMKVFKEKE